MSAGELDKRITIRGFTKSQETGYGDPVETYYDLSTIWAAINPKMGKEFYEAFKVNAEVNTVMKIRFRKLLKQSYRILYGARLYKIKSIINPKEDKKYLYLVCDEEID